MAWVVVRDGGECAGNDEQPWAVVDEDTVGTDEVATDSCHATEDEAQARADALNENEGDEGDDASASAVTAAAADLPPLSEVTLADGRPLPERFHLRWIMVNKRTTDGREFAKVSGTRTLPAPLMVMLTDSHGGFPDDKSHLAGVIDRAEQVGEDSWEGWGAFDLGSEWGREAARQVGNQTLRWISADPELMGPVEIIEEGDCSEEGWMAGACTIVARFTDVRLMGATMVPFPAFPQCVIVPEDVELPPATDEGAPAALALAASGCASCGPSASVLAAPPQPWFADPRFEPGDGRMQLQTEPWEDVERWACPLTVTDDGYVYGHVAPHDVCHIGFPDECRTAPLSRTGYAYYRVHARRLADGTDLPVGTITLGTGHAATDDPRMTWREAQAHYDNTGTAVADVACGEDAYGIWVAGALRPGLSAEQIATFRSAVLSGDWRPVGGHLEMVAVHCVNVPGFPIVRRASFVASAMPVINATSREISVKGEPLALIAGGVRARDIQLDRLSALAHDVATVKRAIRPLMPLAAQQIAASVDIDTNGAMSRDEIVALVQAEVDRMLTAVVRAQRAASANGSTVPA